MRHLLLTLCLACSIPAFAQDNDNLPRLTNKDVLAMVKAEISSDAIIAKIKRSRCNFDTDPSILAELKHNGVPNEVIKAMIEAPYGKPQIIAAPETSKTEPTPTPAPAITRPSQPRTISDSLPTYGNASDLMKLRKVFILADESYSRDLIKSVLNRYEGVTIVYSPDEAEFFIECGVKSSTEARGRQRSHYLRTQMTVFTLDENGRKRVLWEENETYEEERGISFSRPNEVNLTMHFVSMLKKMRGGQKYKGQGRSAAP